MHFFFFYRKSSIKCFPIGISKKDGCILFTIAFDKESVFQKKEKKSFNILLGYSDS